MPDTDRDEDFEERSARLRGATSARRNRRWNRNFRISIMRAVAGIGARKRLPFLALDRRDGSTVGKRLYFPTTFQKFARRWRRQSRAETSMSSFASRHNDESLHWIAAKGQIAVRLLEAIVARRHL